MTMRFLFVIFFSFCCVPFLIAQQTVFAPLGAKWHYGVRPSNFTPDEHYRVFEATHDTVIDGKPCRVVQVTEHPRQDYSYKLQEEYFHVDGQKVYNWLHDKETFNLLYDFSANAGDSWETEDTYFNQGKVKISVESVEYVSVSGMQLKKLNLRYDQGSFLVSFGTSVLERVGGERNMFLYDYAGSDMDIPWFRCYSDQDVSHKDYDKECDFLSAQETTPQLFAPIGTEWYYGKTYDDYPGASIVGTDYILLQATNDTIVEGKLCRVIENKRHNVFCSINGRVIWHQDNDSIFIYDGSEKKFFPVFVWDAKVGDSWTTINETVMTVKGVETVSILGQTLRKQRILYKIRTVNGYSEDEGDIIENIGSPYYLYSFYHDGFATCDEWGASYQGLRCYVHPEWGTYSTSQTACDYQTTSSLEKTISDDIKIIDNHLIIPPLLRDQIDEVRIYTLNGTCVVSVKPDHTGKISMENMHAGMYLIHVISNDSQQVIRFVKP